MTIFGIKSTRAAAAMAMSLCVGTAHAQSELGECGPGPTSGASATHEALFRIDGASRQEADLPAALQQALFDARLEHYKKQLEIIDAAVLEIELERRAAQSGRSRQVLERELFSVAPPDGAAVDAFYQANKARIAYPLEAVQDRIRQMLTQREVQSKQADLVAQVKRDRSFELALAKPVAPYAEIDTEGFPSKGAPDARVTIVEFADYQCPHCQRAAGALRRIAKRYPDEVRVVFMDFPINPSGISRVVAEGAACADRQDRFWRYHDLAFDRQDRLSRDSVAQLAAELDLDVETFQACLDSTFPRERVARSEAEARRLGLSATPTIFLNGRRVHLHDLANDLPQEIDKILAGEKG